MVFIHPINSYIYKKSNSTENELIRFNLISECSERIIDAENLYLPIWDKFSIHIGKALYIYTYHSVRVRPIQSAAKKC